MYYLNTMIFLFLSPLKGMLVTELSSNILTVFSIIKQESEEVAYVEEPLLVKVSS